MTRPHKVSTHLGGRVLIAVGDTIYEEPLHVTAPIRDGLRLVVVLNGSTTLRAGEGEPVEICGPSSLAIFSEGETGRDQVFREGEAFRYVLIQIDRDLVTAEAGVDPAEILRCSPGRRGQAGFVLNTHAADAASQAIAAQILACPETADHDLYRLSKALELTALVLQGFDVHKPAVRPGRLSTTETAQLRAAHDRLIAALDDPPDLAALAAYAGMNAAKLSRGFRLLYGHTPYALLQEERLLAAYRMLASGRVTVGHAATATGYSNSHFATLFRRRFGVSPSSLLPRRPDANE